MTASDPITLTIHSMGEDVTDLFLSHGKMPHGRRLGRVVRLGETAVAGNQIESFLDSVLLPQQREALMREQELTILYVSENDRRYRVNIFFVQRRPVLVVRQVRQMTMSFEDLNLPGDFLAKLCVERGGLVLLVGPTGTGKSTTAACLLSHIARQGGMHVLTVEDPIEYLLDDSHSIVHQRQIGTDVGSYQEAMKHFMFQSPDVIFIGDIHDADLMATALHAAESGPLVIACMHGVNIPRAIEKVLGFFPRTHQERILTQLSASLKGVFSLRLVPGIEGAVRWPAYEAMALTPKIAGLLHEGSINKIHLALEEGASYYHTRTFDQSLADLVLRKQVRQEVAELFADRVDVLRLYVQGIQQLRL